MADADQKPLRKRMEKYADSIFKESPYGEFAALGRQLPEAVDQFGQELVQRELGSLLAARKGLGRYPTKDDEINRLRVLQYIENKEICRENWDSRQMAKDLKLSNETVSEIGCWLSINGEISAEFG